MRSSVYIDGLNFYYGALKGTAYKWLDVHAIAQHLVHRDDELVAVHYFAARVKPSPWDPTVHERQGAYLRAIAALPLVSIHEGSFQHMVVGMRTALEPSQRVQVIKREEKGSDVHLGARLVADAFLGRADRFVLISNDSDFVPAVEIVRHERETRGSVSLRGFPKKGIARTQESRLLQQVV